MYVYVISAGERRQKVGRAANPTSRCSDLQCGSPDTLEVRFTIEVGASGAEVEAGAHSLLQHQRIHREWFDTTLEEAVTAIRRAIAGERLAPARVSRAPSAPGAPRHGTSLRSLRLPVSTWEALSQQASAGGQSVNALVRSILFAQGG